MCTKTADVHVTFIAHLSEFECILLFELGILFGFKDASFKGGTFFLSH